MSYVWKYNNKQEEAITMNIVNIHHHSQEPAPHTKAYTIDNILRKVQKLNFTRNIKLLLELDQNLATISK
jgi:hypothetical protein